MDNLATLGLAIDSSAAVTATSNLDRLTTSAERTGRATDAIREASSQLVAALNRNTTATEALTAKLSAMEAAGTRAGTALASTGAAADAAATNVIKFDRASVSAKSSIDGIAASARNATAAWAALGAMGAATAEKLEIARKMASASAVIAAPPVYQIDQAAAWAGLSGQGRTTLQGLDVARRMSGGALGGQVPSGASGAAGPNGRLRPDQIQNLFFQGSDVFTQAASGGSAFLIAAQQGPQIAQSFIGPGSGSVKGAFAQAGEAATGFIARIGLVGGAFGGLAAAAGIGVAALVSYRSAQRDVELQLTGIGRASGATITQINAIADAQARAGGLSRSSARDIAAGFAGTGAIGPEMIGGVLGTVKDFAKLTGQDASDAGQQLAAAFADPARGADDLNKRLGFLNDTTRENIRRMAEQGDRLGAQRALLAAYRDSIADAAEATSGWSRLTTLTGEAVANAWDKVGHAIDKALTGGTIDQQLAAAQEKLSRAQVAAEGGFGLFSSKDVENAQKDVTRLSAIVDQRNAKIEQAQRAQRSLEVGGLIRSLLPDQQQVDDLANKVEKLRRAISEPAKFGFDTQGFAIAESALGRISRLWQTMADDVARYGTAQTAALVRSAEFNNRLVGATPYGRSSADVEQKFQNDLRDKGIDPVETRRAADAAREEYNRRLSDPNLDPSEGRALSAAREASQRSLRELEGLQRARDLELETLRKTQTIDQTGLGGSFSRLPAEVQQQFLRAGQNPRYANVPLGVAAAITGPESGGRLDIGFSRSLGEDGRRSSAFGLGQITRGTAEEAVRAGYLPQGYDRTNRDTMAEGILGVLSMKIAQNGGDVTRGVMAYRGSSDPAVNRAYAAQVMRNAGQMGDASATGQVRDQAANAQALKQANDNLRLNTELYGRNGAQLEAQTRATEQYNQLLARGVPATEAASIAFGGLTEKLVSVERAGKLVQATRDDDFARDQLGRDRYDQQAFAAARSRFGDTTSPEATAFIGRSRDTAALGDVRSSLTDAAGGFVTALSHGTSAAAAFSNALGRIGDKLISGALDSLIGSAFKGASSGGFLSSVGSLFGFDSGGYTGPGSRYEPRGIVHAGEVVWSQSDVARYGGPSIVDAMRQGLRGYADGGLVGWPTGRAANSNAQAQGQAAPIIHQYDLRGSNLSEGQVQGLITRAVASNNEEQRRTQFERADFDRKAFG